MNLKRLFLTIIPLACQLTVISCHPTLKTERQTLPQESAYNFYKEALDFYNIGSYEEALVTLDTAIIFNSQLAILYKFRAEILQRLKRDHEAIDSYREVLLLHSHDPSALEKMGELYARTNQYSLAIQSVRKAFIQKPEKLHLLIVLAGYYLHENRLDMAHQAAQTYKHQSDKSGKELDDRYFTTMGHLYFKKEKYIEAVSHFRKCRSSKTFTKNEIILFVKAYFHLGQYEPVFSFLSGLSETQISKSDLHFYRGYYYYRKNKLNDALTQFELAQKSGYEDIELYQYLAELYLNKNDTIKADEMNRIINDWAGQEE